MNKTIINIWDIFTKSQFGEVQIGQILIEVKNILGEPVWDSFNESKQPNGEFDLRFLTYDSYEFCIIKFFDSSKVYKLSAFQNDSYQFHNAWDGAFKSSIALDF